MKVQGTRDKRNKRRNLDIRGRSGYEQKVMEFLEAQGVPYEYEKGHLTYIVPETRRRYIPDFSITATELIIEAKGLFTASDRKKMKMVLAQNPDVKIKMLFQRDQAIRKGSNTRYSSWCTRHGIDFAISPTGAVPTRWLTG